MNKALPKRYVSEVAVKKKLKIDDWRKMSKEKFMEFVSMLPYMDKEVALAIIDQFPRFAEFGEVAISKYTDVCNNILEQNRESQAAVIYGYQTILDALAKILEKDNITTEEKMDFADKMIEVADKIAQADLQTKKLLYRTMTITGLVVLGTIGLIGTAIGASSKFGGGDLPELSDNDDDED